MNVNQRINILFVYSFFQKASVSLGRCLILDSDPCSGGHRDILYCGNSFYCFISWSEPRVGVWSKHRVSPCVCVYDQRTMMCSHWTVRTALDLWPLRCGSYSACRDDEAIKRCYPFLLGANLWTAASKTKSFQPPTTSSANTVIWLLTPSPSPEE